jgi:hypothetical protein
MDNDALEIKAILTDEDSLNNEITLSLIRDLKIQWHSNEKPGDGVGCGIVSSTDDETCPYFG